MGAVLYCECSVHCSTNTAVLTALQPSAHHAAQSAVMLCARPCTKRQLINIDFRLQMLRNHELLFFAGEAKVCTMNSRSPRFSLKPAAHVQLPRSMCYTILDLQWWLTVVCSRNVLCRMRRPRRS